MTQLSKQELAESMAEFCGWKKKENGFWEITQYGYAFKISGSNLISEFFDPDSEVPAPKGFFYVLAKARRFGPYSLSLKFMFYEDKTGCSVDYIDTLDEDWLVAFYSAVNEMIKEEA